MKAYLMIVFFLVIVTNYHGQELKEIKIYEYGTRLSEKGFKKNGKREGRWQFYDINEKLSVEKDYKNGIEDGEWIAYENGKIVTRGTLLNGKSTGTWTFYFENGNIYETGLRIDGKSEGLWKRYYENGKLFLVGKYINDKEDGVWKSFHKNGKTQSIWYYKDGKNIGLFQTLDLQGNRVEYGSYNFDSKETGKWRRAIKDYFEEGEFDDGKKIGLWKIIDSMGVLLETQFHINGTDKVKITTYYPSGKVKETYDWVNFKSHGRYREYYENGILMTKGRYYFNHNVHVWRFYNKNGKLDHKTNHESIRKAIKSIKESERNAMYDLEKDSVRILRRKGL